MQFESKKNADPFAGVMGTIRGVETSARQKRQETILEAGPMAKLALSQLLTEIDQEIAESVVEGITIANLLLARDEGMSRHSSRLRKSLGRYSARQAKTTVAPIAKRVFAEAGLSAYEYDFCLFTERKEGLVHLAPGYREVSFSKLTTLCGMSMDENFDAAKTGVWNNSNHCPKCENIMRVKSKRDFTHRDHERFIGAMRQHEGACLALPYIQFNRVFLHTATIMDHRLIGGNIKNLDQFLLAGRAEFWAQLITAACKNAEMYPQRPLFTMTWKRFTTGPDADRWRQALEVMLPAKDVFELAKITGAEVFQKAYEKKSAFKKARTILVHELEEI